MTGFDPLRALRGQPSLRIMRALNVTKWSLVLLSVPALLLSYLYLVTSLTFGINLWRADRPFAIALWFAVVLFPILLLVAIRSIGSPRRFWRLAIAAWFFVAFWAYHQVIWQPWTYGGPWGW